MNKHKCLHPRPHILPTGERVCPHCMISLPTAKEATRKSKYNNRACYEDGLRFPSIAEREYYRMLKVRRDAGEIQYFLCQVPFHLPGKITFYCDFMIPEKDGTIRYVDVKGVETRVFINKKKQVKALYGVDIEVVKKYGRKK